MGGPVAVSERKLSSRHVGWPGSIARCSHRGTLSAGKKAHTGKSDFESAPSRQIVNAFALTVKESLSSESFISIQRLTALKIPVVEANGRLVSMSAVRSAVLRFR